MTVFRRTGLSLRLMFALPPLDVDGVKTSFTGIACAIDTPDAGATEFGSAEGLGAFVKNKLIGV